MGCDVRYRYRDLFRKYLFVGQSQGALVGRFASRQCIPLGHLGAVGALENGGNGVQRGCSWAVYAPFFSYSLYSIGIARKVDSDLEMRNDATIRIVQQFSSSRIEYSRVGCRECSVRRLVEWFWGYAPGVFLVLLPSL